MKAVVVHEYGGPGKLKVEDVPDPVPGEGQVLVRVAATSVNPIDYKLRSGALKEFMPVSFPWIPGHDVSGLVRQLGPGVTGFAAGDKVMALTGNAYAELAAVKVEDLARVPDGLDLIEAAALPLVTQTGEQLITRGVEAKAGQTVLVAGAAGNVGRSAVWTAKKAGAHVIAGIRKRQMEEAAEIHADEAIALDDDSAMEKLGFVDAVADTIGGQTAEALMGKVKQGGVFATVLSAPANAKLHPTIRVVPVQVASDGVLLRTLAEAVAARQLTIPIDRMVPLKDAGEAQAAAEKGGIGKVLLLA